jgi:hypothetical protein
VHQDRRIVGIAGAMEYQPEWVATAFWNGAVGVAVRQWHTGTSAHSIVGGLIVPAYRIAAIVVSGLGGSDHGYVRLFLQDDDEPRWAQGLQVGRGPVGIDPDVLDTASLERELSRSVGIDEPEPEAADALG